MDKLTQNVMNMFGEKGKAWLTSLPITIEMLTTHWKLKNLVPVDNMTFNYVAKAITNTGQPVILKISCDEKSISDEVLALKYFDGSGSIKLIAHNERYHALLLQQAIPGETLKSRYSSQVEYVMDCYVNTMRKLHNKCLSSKNNYRHIRDWLIVIEKLTDHDCPSYLVKKAVALKNELLASATAEIFLHGDLHHDNILKDRDCWLAIDPKGIVGDPEFEIAAFDFMYVNELANRNDVKNIVEARISLLAQKAHLNPQRIKDWVFVRLILMAAWHVEDNSDPSWAITLAEKLITPL
ncbi:aminoglycoside phosphotransferase family protein [Legionella maioricensis]|uniref:Aminoglycoside phosphotransferase family protein n=1 Tax=Legionella maioricensis TaxID=2896528 RepID=A0A9X2IEC6_9GAMM|nr:aminoglycoside phosphotransferase family protein [Legionella maioricensis]MCL9685688.1 aminoglycoside phosphotransferase family protein [Legionella maioricensis]MCL9689090.1 aminoglycoside phosphotransferase family protein [Legionella maioricensis]